MHPGGLRLTDRAVRLAGLDAGMLVADIGCGAGITSSYLTSKFGLSMIGLDISSALIEAGIERYPGLRLIRWDGETLPFEDGCLDALVIECALSVIGPTESILTECARALKKAGSLIVSEVVSRREPASGDGQLLSEAGLVKLLSNAGFHVVIHEDHTPALRTYVAQLREQNGLDFNANLLLGETCLKSHLKLSDFGYVLMIAAKL